MPRLQICQRAHHLRRIPLPLISDLIDKVKDAKLFTKFDIRSGYNNIRFGLSNSPATFQGFMNDSFKDMIAEGWLIVYMDDMLITSGNKKEEIGQKESYKE